MSFMLNQRKTIFSAFDMFANQGHEMKSSIVIVFPYLHAMLFSLKKLRDLPIYVWRF